MDLEPPDLPDVDLLRDSNHSGTGKWVYFGDDSLSDIGLQVKRLDPIGQLPLVQPEHLHADHHVADDPDASGQAAGR